MRKPYTHSLFQKAVPISLGILLCLFSLGYGFYPVHVPQFFTVLQPKEQPRSVRSPDERNSLPGSEAPLVVCGITLKPTVSGCYLVGGQSKATVNVEVAWTDAPAGDSIKVTLGGQNRYIRPGVKTVVYPQVPGNPSITSTQTIVSPQVVAFEINADGGTGKTITANFVGQNSCSASTTFNAPASCAATQCQSPNLGGIVFKDFNDNGKREAGETAGVSGVSVKAVACDGTVYTATTDGYGFYSLPVPATGYPVRVEFSNIPSIYYQGMQGADSRTTVQFVEAPDCSVDLGLINPIDFCSDNGLRVFVPCFTYGDPLVSGSSANADALVSIPYGVSSNTFQGEQPMSKASQIGTVWGLAYNKYTKVLFQSAVLKRHAGLGPLGLGGLYVTDYTNPGAPVTSQFVNVSTDLGISVGSIATNSDRGLVADKTQPSRDAQAFPLIGKSGIGDIDISEDGNTLWLVNLNDKKLYSIDITAYNQNGTKPTSANVNSVVIPASCVGGEYRPWAVKVNEGKVYVGGVCDGQSSANKSNLRASVYEVNGASVTQIFDFPLTYPKGYPAAQTPTITGWFPWTDTFDDLRQTSTSTILRHPVPVFTDIEFDIDGSMVLGFGDRTGLQGGDRNYRPDGTSTTLFEVNSQAGDILRAFASNNTFVLENNAKAGPNTGYGPGNSQGPGFGEFYNDNWVQDGAGTVLYHAEQIMGGLALKPGSGEVVVTTIDPVDKHPYAGGVRYMNNTSGLVTGAYAIYITRGPDGSPNPGTFAKATGLGDAELNCATINVMEVGNRVWIDANKDGVQDACEKALKGVNVALYKGNALIATTTTNANGEYYFSSKSKLALGTWSGTGADTALLPKTKYSIAFGTGGQYSDDTLVVSGVGKFLLTSQNTTTGTGNDLNDSDAFLFGIGGGTYPVDTVTTGVVGQKNHSLDAGFFCIEPAIGSVLEITPGTCTGFASNNDGKLELTGAPDNFDKFRVTYGTTFPADSSYATATAVGSTFPLTILADIPNRDTLVTVRFYNGECCYKDTVLTLEKAICAGGSLGDFVWKDANRNGKQDEGEIGVDGVKVILWSAVDSLPTTKLDSTITANGGLYLFDSLAKGDYLVQFVKSSLPAECSTFTARDTTNVPGIDDANDSDADTTSGFSGVVSLDPVVLGQASTALDSMNTNNLTIDAGLLAPIGSLGDFVWKDLNDNGRQDAGEPGVNDVKVILWSAVGGSPSAKLDSTLTAGNGAYSFTGLLKGDYIVQLDLTTLPDSCTISSKPNAAGVPDSLDSDFDPASGLSQVVSLDPTVDSLKNNPTIDAALFTPKGSLGDFVWKDLNDNGRQDTGEPGVDGVKVILWSAVGGLPSAKLDSTLTAGGGAYSFAGLLTGDYLVLIDLTTLPDSCVISSKQDAAGVPDSLDSDFGADGLSQVVSIDPTLGGISKDNPTIDAALFTPCVKPLIGSITTITATCGQTTDNNDASFTIRGLSGGDRYTFATSIGGLSPYTSATALLADSIHVENLPNPASPSGQTYFVRVYNGKEDCFSDTTLTLSFIDCSDGPCFGTVLVGDNQDTLCSEYFGEPMIVKVGNNKPVKFVRFDTPQTASSVNTGGVVLETVDPALGSDSLARWPSGIPGSQFPANTGTTPFTYYIYAVAVDQEGQSPNCLPPSKEYTILPLPAITQSTEPVCADSTTYTATLNLPAGTYTVTLARQVISIGNGPVPQDIIETRSGLTGSGVFSLAVADSSAVFVVQNEVTGCASASPVIDPAFVECVQLYDLALDKSIDKKLAMLGETVNYTIRVWNEGQGNATGVEVTDSLNAGVQYVSHVAAAGNYDPVTKIWTIDSLNVGDTLTLTVAVKVVAQGVWFNTAEITKMNEEDVDSTPGNGENGEDDIDRECFTVPVQVCRGQGTAVELAVPDEYTGVVWFRKTQNGQPVQVAQGNIFIVTETELGSYEYTFTSSSGSCPAEGCCPTIIVVEDCCPVDVCVPFVITKRKK